MEADYLLCIGIQMRNTFVFNIFQQFKLEQFKEDSQFLVRAVCQWLARLASMLNQTSDLQIL